MRTGGGWLVPASMREDVKVGAQPLDSAGTNRKATTRAPAPTREVAIRGGQPLECAWTNVETDAKSLVPAPRLELGAGSEKNIARLACITQVALEGLERGKTRHPKAILPTLKEVLS
jgi:hypothetical protein